MEKIIRQNARKCYNAGQAIIMCACNLNPVTHGMKVCNAWHDPFETMENAFRYYNCINKETGYEVAFYMS